MRFYFVRFPYTVVHFGMIDFIFRLVTETIKERYKIILYIKKNVVVRIIY